MNNISKKGEGNRNQISSKSAKPELSLGYTQRDLKNPGVAKGILAENQRLQGEANQLKKSLRLTQDSFEKLRQKYHTRDKENAVMKEKYSLLSRFEIIKSLSLIGVGSAISFLIDKKYLTAAATGIISFILLLVVTRKDTKVKR